MIRTLPLACLATTLVAGGASAQTFGVQPQQPRQTTLFSSSGLTPIQGAPLPQSGFQMAPSAPLPVLLEAGGGRLLTLPAPASTVLAADPKVVRVQAASPTSIFVIGVAPGRTNILATAEDGTAIVEYGVTVRGGQAAETPAAPQAAAPAPVPAGPSRPSAAALEAALRQMLRGAASLRVRSVPNGYILSGTVATPTEAQKAETAARGFLTDDQSILNEIEVLSSVQVNLRVRVMEISRDVTRNLGFSWQALASQGNFVLGMAAGTSAAYATTSVLRAANNSRLAIGASSPGKYDVNSIIDALAQDRLATILAEPNLTAQSGEIASFLAGGEFPVPVGAAITGTITIAFKQFGVSLAFVPTVLGPDRVNLRVRPEVSELTDNGAVEMPLAGGTVRIPALSVRRAETTVELGSGQSFAVAGLLQRNTAQVASGLAGVGEIPVLGALFRSNAFRRAETELVIIVTPYLVRPVSDPNALQGPTENFRPATDLDRVLYMRQAARGVAPARPGPAVPQDSGFLLE